ncbi:hypothetical protein H9Y04_23430 [Streptomyces sp. TRM66268-LWL]|uniref:Helix-hairpin-helix domain-containing protein n=1 Tax=Streptomyces polyasparticus TaxID=2767826 RepID=A0ABR7SJ35_9ACTN|nr:hypothetical protein [Streptomyces polyasparticus]MBC9715505.1 hypothetical protein [Streptomyces polyasparticus]
MSQNPPPALLARLVLRARAWVHAVAARVDESPGSGAASTGTEQNRDAAHTAAEKAGRRKEARQLLAKNPAAARELRIGRPDLPRAYDDGGLVDINGVSADVLVHELGWSAVEAVDVIEARERLGRFDGPNELISLTGIPPARVDAASDRLVYSA